MKINRELTHVASNPECVYLKVPVPGSNIAVQIHGPIKKREYGNESPAVWKRGLQDQF